MGLFITSLAFSQEARFDFAETGIESLFRES